MKIAKILIFILQLITGVMVTIISMWGMLFLYSKNLAWLSFLILGLAVLIYYKFDPKEKADGMWLMATWCPFALIIGGTAAICVEWFLWEYMWLAIPFWVGGWYLRKRVRGY